MTAASLPQLSLNAEFGESFDEVLSRSETAIEELREKFPQWSRAYVEDMRTLAAAIPGDGAAPADLVQNIHAIAHNLKGMGASFGYPLVTEAGQGLCAYLRRAEAAGRADRRVIDTILKCLDVVLEHKIAGEGGEMGQKLTGRLQQIVDDAMAQLPA